MSFENIVMTLPIKKRINIGLFIDRKAALSIGQSEIRVVTKEGDQPALLADRRNEYTFRRNAAVLDIQKVWE